MAEYVTKTGKVLTDADIEALADEAERGYDVSHLPPADRAQVEKALEKIEKSGLVPVDRDDLTKGFRRVDGLD